MQVANSHVKRCRTPLVIREIKIKLQFHTHQDGYKVR